MLLHDHAQVERDIRNQQEYWSRLLSPPPAVDRESRAYLEAAFGTHEVVLYLRMLHTLIVDAWTYLAEREADDRDVIALVSHLERRRQEWMHDPQESLLNKPPAYLIDRERARLPVQVQGEEMMVDCECPICQMMADSDVPGFWFLDDFDLYDDLDCFFFDDDDPWEGERVLERLRSGDAFVTADEDLIPYDLSTDEATKIGSGLSDIGSPWQRTYVNMEMVETERSGLGRSLLVFGIAGCLAELIEDLRDHPAGVDRVAQLNEIFSTLRDGIARDEMWLVRSLLEEMAGGLDELAAAHPGLAAKSEDLQAKLRKLAEMLSERQAEHG